MEQALWFEAAGWIAALLHQVNKKTGSNLYPQRSGPGVFAVGPFTNILKIQASQKYLQ